MTNVIQSIAIDKLIPHPYNPNQMSKANFKKLVRNIKLNGRYEPLVVRPCPDQPGSFQIINGHHRLQALLQLGYKQADAVVWDVDDEQTEIFLATLNRLGGSDIIDKKIALLAQLSKRMRARELAKLLPQTAKQIERLTSLKDSLRRASSIQYQESSITNPIVFFISDQQRQVVEDAISLATAYLAPQFTAESSASKKAAALTKIAEEYLAGRKEKT